MKALSKQRSTVEIVDLSSDFEIQVIHAQRIEEILSKPNLPHRHNYQEIIWVENGCFTHVVDGNRSILQGPGLAVVPKGHIHQLLPQRGLSGFSIRFRDEFLSESIPSLLGPFCDLGYWRLEKATKESLWPILELLLGCKNNLIVEARRHLLMAFLSQAKSYLTPTLGLPQKSVNGESVKIWRRIETLIEVHFTLDVSYAHLAKEAFVSERTLQQVAKSMTGKSISDLIEGRRILEAKRLMKYSDYGLKEVAHAIGFQDPSYFSRVFKKREGVTPSQYRMQNGNANMA